MKVPSRSFAEGREIYAVTQAADVRNLLQHQENKWGIKVPVVHYFADSRWGGFYRLDFTKVSDINFLFLMMVEETCEKQRWRIDTRPFAITSGRDWKGSAEWSWQTHFTTDWSMELVALGLEIKNDEHTLRELIAQAQILGTEKLLLLNGKTPAGNYFFKSR